MEKTDSRIQDKPAGRPRRRMPPEHLVIYEIQGAWSDEDARESRILGTGFLGRWIEGGYTFLFFDREAEEYVRSLLQARPDLQLRQVHRMKYAQWQDGARFHPFSVGGLTIVPAWHAPPDEPNRMMLRIDPGLAFGFGGHPTTQACLQALNRVYREDRPVSVLDLGTGTGILALAAARFGARRIRAVDYSHLAADTARENVSLNGLDQVIEVIRGRAEDYLDDPADLVCANLHFQIQETILARGGFHGRRWLILSGLFHAQAETMAAALTAAGYRIVDQVREPRWATLLLRAKDPGADSPDHG